MNQLELTRSRHAGRSRVLLSRVVQRVGGASGGQDLLSRCAAECRAIRFLNHLDDPRDLDDLRTCVHQAREVISRRAFDPFRGDAVPPWATPREDAEIDAVIRELSE